MSFRKLYREKLGFLQGALEGYYSDFKKEFRVPDGFYRITEAYVKRRGKLLRPFITLLILDSFGKDYARHRKLMGAIELMEASTISFDDLVDASPFRRGGAFHARNFRQPRGLSRVSGGL